MPNAVKRLTKLYKGDELDEFSIDRYIGEGLSQTAKAYVTTGDEVVKLFVLDKTHQLYKFRYEKFKNESAVLKKLEGSPYVLNATTDFRDSAVHNKEIKEAAYYTMELMDGNVQELILKEDVPLLQKLDIINQTILAMIDFHAAEICHRDLYSPNVLFKREGGEIVCKVADFGSAKELNKPQIYPYHFPTGHRGFSSPESVSGLLGGDTVAMAVMSASDNFSLGMMMYEVLTAQNQDNVMATLASVYGLASSMGMYDPKTSEAERMDFLTKRAIPTMLMAHINDISASDIMSTPEIASELNGIMKDLMNYDYHQRLSDLPELSARILEMKSRVEAKS